MPDVQVLLAVQGPGETDLVSAISRAPGLTVSRRCGDVAELLAAAGARLGTVAVVSASHLGIDRVVVDRLRQMGVLSVGLAAPEDTGRVAALGVDAVVDQAGGTQAVLAALTGVRDLPPPPPPPEEPQAADGVLVTVWGTTGAPGRTTLAVNLAHTLTRHGTVGLVDADTRAPSVAQVLGLVDESSALALAVRAATQGRLDAATLDRSFPRVGQVAVMTGLTRPDRWREAPAAGLEVVLERAARVSASRSSTSRAAGSRRRPASTPRSRRRGTAPSWRPCASPTSSSWSVPRTRWASTASSACSPRGRGRRAARSWS